MDNKISFTSRLISASLCSVILLTSPGPQAFAQAARILNIKVQTPVNSAGTAAVSAMSRNFSGSFRTLSAAGLSQNQPSLSVSVVPAVRQDRGAAVARAAGEASAAAVPAGLQRTLGTTPMALPAGTPAAIASEYGATEPAAAITVRSGRLSASAARMRDAAASIISSVFASRKDTTSGPEAYAPAPVAGRTAAAAGTRINLLASRPASAPRAARSEAAPLPEAPDPGTNDKSWFGLGKVAVMFIGALLIAQVGVEALGAAMPALVQKTFGDFTVVAQLGIFASIAGIVGRTLGPAAVDKFGLKKSYLASSTARLVSITALCALLATGHMTLPLMMLFYSINGLLGGVSITAETSIPPALVGQNPAKLERFWTWKQTLLEIIGVTGPIATGAIVSSFGFLPALIAFPVSFAVAITVLALTMKIPQKLEALRLADRQKALASGQPAAKSVGDLFKEFFRKIGNGAKLVWRTPVLRNSFLAFTVFMMTNPFLYSMLAPAYGMRLVGAQNAELSTSIYGTMTGLYSLGGLLGGFLMMWEQKKISRLKKGTPDKAPISDAEESEILRKSMLRWMLWGTVGLAAIATMVFPLPAFLGSLTLPALALIPFGIAQVICVVKLQSFFQSKAPAKDMADAMGFFGSASLLVSTVGLLALKYLFKGLTGFTPFYYIALALIPLAAYQLYLKSKLDKSSAPGK